MVSFLLVSLGGLTGLAGENIPPLSLTTNLDEGSHKMMESGGNIWLVNLAWTLGIVLGLIFLIIGVLGARKRR